MQLVPLYSPSFETTESYPSRNFLVLLVVLLFSERHLLLLVLLDSRAWSKVSPSCGKDKALRINAKTETKIHSCIQLSSASPVCWTSIYLRSCSRSPVGGGNTMSWFKHTKRKQKKKKKQHPLVEDVFVQRQDVSLLLLVGLQTCCL